MSTHTQLVAAVNMLDFLGDTIPQYLAAEGFRGEPGSALDDPVAHYLIATIPAAVAARCDAFMVEVIDEYGAVTDVYTPRAITDFMTRFDLGEFPNLIAGNPSTDSKAA